MNKNEIIEKVKIDYEVVLVNFQVYESAISLYEDYKDDLEILADENMESSLVEEENVFKIEDIWIYASEWYDVEWDD